MHSALIRILVGVGVGLGLTLTSATTAATAAPAFSDRMVAQAAGPDCSAQAAALSRARNNYGQRMRVFKQARNAVLKAQRAEKRAKTRKAKRAKHRVVVRAQKRLRTQRTKLRSARANVATRKGALNRCRNTPPPPPPAEPTPASPIQALCDQGVPQEVCTQLAAQGGGTLQTTLGELCTAQPDLASLCDVLAGVVPDPAGLQDLVTTLHGILDSIGREDLLDDVLGEIGLTDLIGQSALEDLLDQLGLGGLVCSLLC
jgi:hypothetical protein